MIHLILLQLFLGVQQLQGDVEAMLELSQVS